MRADLEPQVLSFKMGVTLKIEVNNAFKEHLVCDIPRIEGKYSKGNFIDGP